MELDLDDDQRQLKEGVARRLSASYADFGRRKDYLARPEGFDPSVWSGYAEAGLLALPLPAEYGGLGGGAVENLIVMEEFGRALAVEPYLTSVILCGAILREGAPQTLKHTFFERMAAGTAILALAQQERHSRHDLHAVSLRAAPDGDDFVLDGAKAVVIGGARADALIVSARTAGAERDPHGITLFLVDAGSAGLSRRGYRTQDGFAAADVLFHRTRVPRSRIIGEPGHGLALLGRGVEEGVAALCAEAVGAMDALVQLTVDYLKTRRQFGVPIGSFQVLQHRAVDMLVMLELARSMAIYAALSLGGTDEAARSRAISEAKVQIGRSARFIGQQATQLHGGIGITMEYKGGHYFKRLTMIEQAFGDTEHHLRAIAAAPDGIAS